MRHRTKFISSSTTSDSLFPPAFPTPNYSSMSDTQPKAYSVDMYTDGVQPRVSNLYFGRFVDRFVILPGRVEIVGTGLRGCHA